MKEKPTFGRTLRWTWAVSAAIIVHIVLYWGVALTRSGDQQLKRQNRQFAQIQYIDAESASRSNFDQRLSLFDPRPLLLPTKWNASNAASLLGVGQEETDIFPDFSPMFELEDGNYVDDFGNVPATYDRLTVAQSDFSFPLYRELGRIESDTAPPQFAKGMYVAVSNPATGFELSHMYIYNEATEALKANWPGRSPATFLATVHNSFQVGGLSVVASSGFDEADREMLAITYANFPRLGHFEDGLYLLEIVP